MTFPGFLDDATCRQLIDIHNRHARKERFTYATAETDQLLGRATREELALVDSVRFRVLECVRRVSGNEELLSQYTDIACYSEGAIKGAHVDNAFWEASSGSWVGNEVPFRQMSAVLYLNSSGDDYEGGEFVYCSDPLGKVAEEEILPRTGKLIVFSSGPENIHGVKRVRAGRRFTVAMWFSTDRSQAEPQCLVETGRYVA